MASPSSSSYFTDVLRGLGASPQAVQGSLPFLLSWAGREGVPQGIDPYNLLGTTLPVGGSHGTNGPGVQAYPSYQAGVEATRRMLQQGNFSAIRNALLSGNVGAYRNDPNVQHEFLSWSGNGYNWPTSSGQAPALPAGGGSGGSPAITGSAPAAAGSPAASSGPSLAALISLIGSQQSQQQPELPSWSNVPTSSPSLLPLLMAAG